MLPGAGDPDQDDDSLRQRKDADAAPQYMSVMALALEYERNGAMTAFSQARRTLLKHAGALPFAALLATGTAGAASTIALAQKAEAAVASAPATADSIVRLPTEVPPPIGKRAAQRVRVDLHTVELMGQLADGTTYRYWTFNGKVPGPMFRVRVGDTVDVHLKNSADSWMNHNVDFHAVTGPGGGAHATEAGPGEEKSFSFKALKPGLFVYHCATPSVAQHIANGMFGMILVEPEGGLEPVDREFYVMQSEIYTEEPFGQRGEVNQSYEKLLAETPEYYVFNGAVDALAKAHPLKARVGERVRLFFGVGGPNKTSSFHVIGEILDKVYDFGGLRSEPLADVQTVTVPPGGAMMAELKLEVPGQYVLVDHAISRVERGLKGFLVVEGPANAAIFRDNAAPLAG